MDKDRSPSVVVPFEKFSSALEARGSNGCPFLSDNDLAFLDDLFVVTDAHVLRFNNPKHDESSDMLRGMGYTTEHHVLFGDMVRNPEKIKAPNLSRVLLPLQTFCGWQLGQEMLEYEWVMKELERMDEMSMSDTSLRDDQWNKVYMEHVATYNNCNESLSTLTVMMFGFGRLLKTPMAAQVFELKR